MDRSLGFGSTAHNFRPLQTRSRFGSGALRLNLAAHSNSPARSTKSTRSLSLPLLVNIGFQVLFHSPPGVLFTFPSRYYALSVDISILAWRVVPPASHRITRVLWYSGYPPLVFDFAYGTFTLSGSAFQPSSTISDFDSAGPQPRYSVESRFGLFPVRSPLLRKSIFLSLPPAT